MLKLTMTPASTCSLLLLLTMGVAWSEGAPRKQPVGRYSTLWTKSPICEPPPPIEKGEEASALDDYTLAGVSPMADGYSVILINKKKRDERVHLLPGMQNEHGFKVKSVRQDPISNKNTTVEITMANGKVGRVGYEEKFLALKPGVVAANKQNDKNKGKQDKKSVPLPAGANPAGKTSTPPKPNTPKVRRVPAPNR